MVRKGIIDMTILWPTGAYGRSTPEVGGCSSRRVEAWYICVGGTGCRSAHVGGRCARKYRCQNEEFLHLRTLPASSVIFFFGVCFRGRAVNAIATRTDVEGRKDLPTPRAGRADPSISVMAFVGDTKKFICNYPRPYSKRDNYIVSCQISNVVRSEMGNSTGFLPYHLNRGVIRGRGQARQKK